MIGDITLCRGEIAIVIAKEWQNRHLGRKCVRAVLQRAKQIGYRRVEAKIYPFNLQSRAMFLSVGFFQVSDETYEYRL